MKQGRSGGGRLARILPFSVLGLAALLRIFYLVLYARRIPFYKAPVVDARIYDLWAHTIASGDWLSRGEGVFYRAPLYPYLMAVIYRIFGGPVPWIPIAQLLLGLVLLYLSGRFARRLGGWKAETAALAALALYGPLMAVESKLLATTVGLVLQLAALLLALQFAERPSFKRGFAAGAVLGLAILVRPQWLLLVVVIPLVLAFATPGRTSSGWVLRDPRRMLPRAAAAARSWAPFWIGCALIIAPVTARNRLIGGDWVLVSSNGGMTFFQGNNEENRSGLLTIVRKFELFGSATEQRVLETRVAEREMGRSLKPSETSAFWSRQAWSFILGRPAAWLALEGKKLYRLVTSYEYADNYSYYIEKDRLWPLRLAFVPFGLLLALGALGLAAAGGERAARRLVITSAVFGLAGCLLFYVSSRYRMEAVPALAILGGSALARLFGPAPVPRRRLAAGAIAAICLFAASFLPAGLPALSQESITYLQLGNALEGEKRFREAEAAYRQSVADLPINVYAWDTLALLVSRLDGAEPALRILDSAPRPIVSDHPLTRYARGYLLVKLGREEEAVKEFEAALQGNPLMREAHFNLALLYEKQRDYPKAEGELVEALRLGRDDPEALSHLAYVRIQLRRYAEAQRTCRDWLAVRPRDTGAALNLAVASFYLGQIDSARAALARLPDSLTRGASRDPLVLYYEGLVSLRLGESDAAARQLAGAAEADPTNRRSLYYLSLARAAGGRLDNSWPGWREAWAEAFGPEVRPALVELASYLEARSETPWGAADRPAQEAALLRVARAPGGDRLAAEIRRYREEEASEATRSP